MVKRIEAAPPGARFAEVLALLAEGERAAPAPRGPSRRAPCPEDRSLFGLIGAADGAATDCVRA